MMNNTKSWKQKLGSRKLWAAAAAAILAIITASFGNAMGTELAEIAKTGIYGLITYVFGESAVDVARVIAGNTVRTTNGSGADES